MFALSFRLWFTQINNFNFKGAAGECSFSDDSSKCLICSQSDKYIAYPEASGSECVSSASCPSTVAVLAADAIAGIN